MQMFVFHQRKGLAVEKWAVIDHQQIQAMQI